MLFRSDCKEYNTEEAPAAYHQPLLPYQCSAGTRNAVNKHHASGHQNCHRSNKFVRRNTVRTRHIRLFLPQDQEGKRYHTVGGWSLLGVVFFAVCKFKYKEKFGSLIELISDEDAASLMPEADDAELDVVIDAAIDRVLAKMAG